MRRLIFIALVVLLAGAIGVAEEPPVPQVSPIWEKIISTSGPDWIYAVAMDSQRNVYAVGTLNNDYLTIKYNSSGTEVWRRTFNAAANGVDEALALAVDSAGNVYVTGKSDGGTGYRFDWLTIKYDASGNRIWLKRYYPSSGDDIAVSIAIDNAGGVYVTGVAMGTVSQTLDIVTKKYAASDGTEGWTKVYNGPGNGTDTPYKIGYGAGKVYVLGLAAGGASGNDLVTIAYDAVSGTQLWSDLYNGTSSGSDWARDLALDGSGNVYVTGGAYETGTDCDIVTIKYVAGGSRAWVAKYDGPDHGFDMGRAVAADADGNVYVTGFIYTGSAKANDYILIKYNSAGAKQWAATYNGTASSDDQARSIMLDDAGNIYISGRSTGIGTGFDCATLKYASNGNLQWFGRYNGAGNGLDSGEVMAVDTTGFLYVAGAATGAGGSFDCLLLKYDINAAPMFIPYLANQTVLEGDTLVYTITGRDWDVPAQTLTLAASNLPAGATFDVTGTNPIQGVLTYATNYDMVAHPDTQVDIPNLTLTLSDGKAEPVVSSITISVVDENRAPLLDSIGDKAIDEGQYLAFVLSASDPDNDALTYSATGLPAGATLADGVFSWTPDYTQAGAYPIHFEVTDGIAIASEDITITVNNVNQAPVLNPIGNRIMDEGTLLTFTIAGSDPDGDPVTFPVPSIPSGATYDPVTMTFSFTPTEAQGPGTYLATFSVSDGLLVTSETITITVNEVNLPPKLKTIANQIAYVGESFSQQLTCTDSDIPAQTLTYSAEGLPSGLSIDSATGLISGLPTLTGDYPVIARASDGGLEDSISFNIEVRPGSSVPVEAGGGASAGGVSLVFDTVTELGTTTATPVAEPANLVLFDNANLPLKGWLVETTANISGDVTMTVYFGDVTTSRKMAKYFTLQKDIDGDGVIETKSTRTTLDLKTYTISGTFSGMCPLAAAIRPMEEIDGVIVKAVPGTMNLKSKGVFTVFIAVPPLEVLPAELDLTTVSANGKAPVSVRFDQESYRIIAKFARETFPFGNGTITATVMRTCDDLPQVIRGSDTIILK